METYFKRVSQLTPTRFWINNVTFEEAKLAIEEGAEGCTQNPSYVWKILNSELKDYADAIINQYKQLGLSSNDILIHTQRHIIQEVAEIFMPMYNQSNGKLGYVSIQGDPINEDADTIIKTALFNAEASKNIMVKIPVTEEGLKAISILASKGIPINATEIMTVRQAIEVCEVYKKATCNLDKKAPLYFSVITGIYDEYIQNYVKENSIDISKDIVWQAGMCVAKKIAELCSQYDCGFIGGGARGLHHFTEMVGAKACITINWKGTAESLIQQNPIVVDRFHTPVSHSVIEELYAKLPDFKKAYFYNEILPHEYEDFGPVVLFRSSFVEAWKNCLVYIESK